MSIHTWLQNKKFMAVLKESSFKENGCIEYRSHCKSRPVLYDRGKSTSASRMCWEIVNGEIENNLFVLHSCDNKYCINVDHLRLGTQQDNINDMWERDRVRFPNVYHQSKKTHCPKGHEYSGDNLGYGYRRGKFSNRYCKTCSRTQQKEYHNKIRGK